MAKKSKAEKVPYIHPTIDILYQVSFDLLPGKPKNDPGTQIHMCGCRFMCMLAIVQFISGKAFSKQDIISIYNTATSGELGDDVMLKNCTTLGGEYKLIRYALDYIGNKKHMVQQTMVTNVTGNSQWNMDYLRNHMPGEGNIYYIIVDFNTKSGPEYGGHHFVLFNSIGELIYDPSRGTVKSYRTDAGAAVVDKLLYYQVTNRT